jgi:hypothetical protein
MSSIDPTTRLLTYLRQQTQELRTHANGAPATARTRRGTANVADRTQVEIATLDRTDPQARRRAFRIFLRGVLARELGSSVANDPQFPALVKRVQDTMEADNELLVAIDRAGDLLLQRAASTK